MTGFKEVVGREDIIQYIQKAIENGIVSPAYLFCGEKGAGKKMLANLFARVLQCEEGGVNPCNECRACKQLLNGNHPDVVYVTHEKPGSISVDDIRDQINRDIMIKPYNGKHKIYVIPEADIMTVQAQNALLKTLEEPPEYVIFFLLAENPEKLLATVTSRCVALRLRDVKDALIKHYLMEQLETPDYKATICTAFAQGNIGKAIMLATSEHFGEIKEAAIELLKKVNKLDVDGIVTAVKNITKYKIDIMDYLDILMVWYRDVLIYKATREIGKVVFSDQLKAIKEQAKMSSYEGIETILKSIETAKVRIRANVNFDLIMELLLLAMKEN